ncbi:MAG TPA: hypothetical protein VGJ04_09100 [Pirellulales bacterium]
MPGIACMLSPAAGAVVVQHDGADDVAQQEAAVEAQHDDADDEQQPQALAGAADATPMEADARTIESNLNMQNSFNRKPKGRNTHLSNSRSGISPDRDTTESFYY